MLTETYKNMLALLSDVLNGRSPDKPGDKWADIYAEMKAQAVHIMPASCMTALGLNSKEENDYFSAVFKSRTYFHSLMKDQTKMIAALDAAGIKAVVLKGAAAAANYPHPENRCMGDIDLLVAKEDFVRAYDVLIAAGCTSEQSPHNTQRHAVMKTADGHSLELHLRFSSRDSTGDSDYLDGMLSDAVARRVNVSVAGYEVPSLPPIENGIVLLAHINQHLRDGLGLRQIVDWYYFVKHHLDDGLWAGGFADAAERVGMKRLAEVTTAMCRKYLGLDSDIHWCKYEPICDELMEYILYNGNFGRKDDTRTRLATSVLMRTSNPIKALKEAQSCGLTNWRACQKHLWLRPFAWLYQLFRWAFKGAKLGMNAGTMKDASKASKYKKDFLDRLGVTRA